ncbi:MAG: (Fe-S)-binding protein [Arenimonas sp.]|nr:(Fe-S)-binding protein [Arenimonas sp.]
METSLSPSQRSGLAQQCVRCGLCLPHCPTYAIAQTEAESPRGRIALMAMLADNPDLCGHSPYQSLDHCLSCRRCEAVCPAHVSYEQLLLATRASYQPQTTLKTRSLLWLMAHKPWLNALLNLYRIGFALLPKSWRFIAKPAHVSQVRSKPSRNALFTGCIADTYEKPIRNALLKLLHAVGESAEIPTNQACCGQAARHAGDTTTARKLAANNQAALNGYERLLVLASGCHSALQETLGIPVIDACNFLQQHSEKLQFRSAQGLKIALHTPCTASFNHSQRAVLAILQRIPDLQIIALPDQGCCGAAGMHHIDQPERAATLRAPILADVEASQATYILSQNIGCRLHLQNAASVPVLHPIEFMAQFLHET